MHDAERNGLCGYKIVILGVKIDKNTFYIDTSFIYISGISFLFKTSSGGSEDILVAVQKPPI